MVDTLAIVDAFKSFRPILEGRQLALGTDHKNLVPMLSFADRCNASPRMTRWAMELSPWNLRRIMHYVPGAKLPGADFLSRPREGETECFADFSFPTRVPRPSPPGAARGAFKLDD